MLLASLRSSIALSSVFFFRESLGASCARCTRTDNLRCLAYSHHHLPAPRYCGARCRQRQRHPRTYPCFPAPETRKTRKPCPLTSRIISDAPHTDRRRSIRLGHCSHRLVRRLSKLVDARHLLLRAADRRHVEEGLAASSNWRWSRRLHALPKPPTLQSWLVPC